MTPATLHARLVAAVQQRLDVARAADSEWGEDQRQLVGEVSDATADHVLANDPATVIRHCERDLKVLERHEPCTGEHTPAQVAMAWDLARVNYRHQVPWCHRCWAPAPCEVLIDEAFAYDVAVEVDRG